MKRILLFFLIGVFSSGSFASETRIKPYEDYIKKYAPLAMAQQLKYGIPSSITLAQGLLESNAGNSALAKNANNHFGIKCHRGWTGKTYSHFDDGQMSCFRKYGQVADSYQDHSQFIVTASRYDFLFDLNVRNYKAWAKGLKSAGYATDKQYAKKLIKIIQLYDLNEYVRYAANHPRKVKRMAKSWTDEDEVLYARLEEKVRKEPVQSAQKENQYRESAARNAKDYNYLSEESKGKAVSRNQYNQRTDNLPQYINAVQKHTIQYKGSVPYVVVQYGDTYRNLADEFGISPQRLKKINELPADYRFQTGDVLFLNKKMNIWDGENDSHMVRSGESMHYIAQLYGLKVMSLYELNGLNVGDRIEVGQKLKLR